MKSKQSTELPFKISKDSNNSYQSIVASKSIPANALLCYFSYQERLQTPNRYTVQLGEKEHILLVPSLLQYINHSCEPNVFFDTSEMELRSLKALKEGEEVCYFYPSTEWDMKETFTCNCKNSNCLQEIRGAAYLTEEQFKQAHLNEFIRKKYLNQKV